MIPLPIDPLLPEIVAALAQRGAAVIEAPPGAGKTTRVPRALLDLEAPAGEIVVLQPRRLPARLGAARVADELGERVGDTVGYTVRFEEVGGPRTRVRFVTEGILTRRLLADPELRGVGTVVLDEFHERHIATDLTLALVQRLRRGSRPDLRLCVMSATLDAEALAAYLDDCPRLRSEGRRFDVAIDHLPQPDDRPLPVQVSAAVRRAVREGPPGDVLVFLPGAAEIRRCEEALAELARAADLSVMALHGDLPLEAQARVVGPSPRRKVILSTNVAETSVTIDGVVAVVDSGLARIAGHSPWTGLPQLSLGKISQASAIQRAGRAGRTRPGVAYRLYTRHDFEQRRAHETPEIARLDLAEVVLTLRALGVRDVIGFDWLTPPPVEALTIADELLRRLGATDAGGGLTARGRRMLRFPLHPRLGRLLVEAEDREVGEEGAILAALIGERDIRERGALGAAGNGPARGRPGGGVRGGGGADVIALLESFEHARAGRFGREVLRAQGLDVRAVEAVERARRQLAGQLQAKRRREAGLPAPAPRDRLALDRELAQAALAGFPDRVGRVREPGSRTLVLAAGGTAELGYDPDSEFLLALDAEERATTGRAASTTVRLGCGIDPDWLADVEGGDLRATDAVELDAATERVVRRSRLSFGALTLDETVRPADPSPETSRLLAEAARARGLDAFDEPGALDALRARLDVLRRTFPDLPVPAFDEQALRDVLTAACDGLRSFAELRAAGLVSRVVESLPPAVKARLASDAPVTVKLPGGRAVPVHYVLDQPPWIESRLQDFFGMARGPAIAGGRVPLTLHLLAPNGRAVQVTNDLESFWARHYPPLRRELGRRYPRHAWPEDGRTATPPPPKPPRPRS
ncbi:MAG TPA: ATP-dependent helicase C-terminal domain-containing protein [Polyangia bacterium]